MPELVVAFDLPTGREVLALADRLPGLAWAKVGPGLYLREGPALVRELTSRGVRVFLDLKWHDIPSTVAAAVHAARDLGVTMATVHCLGGVAMLRAAAGAAGGLGLVGVTVLTVYTPAAFGTVVGREIAELSSDVLRLARLALDAGLVGVVASPLEVAVLREAIGPRPWIVVPGIRRPGDARDDQARVATPRTAARAGATHIVVGRAITSAADPAAAYGEIVQELEPD